MFLKYTSFRWVLLPPQAFILNRCSFRVFSSGMISLSSPCPFSPPFFPRRCFTAMVPSGRFFVISSASTTWRPKSILRLCGFFLRDSSTDFLVSSSLLLPFLYTSYSPSSRQCAFFEHSFICPPSFEMVPSSPFLPPIDISSRTGKGIFFLARPPLRLTLHGPSESELCSLRHSFFVPSHPPLGGNWL